MEKLIALGTGYAVASQCYTTCFALDLGEDILLIDSGGGNGLLTRLRQGEIAPEGIHHLFLSHKHTDHILGAVWLIRIIGHSLSRGQYEGRLHIYCPQSLIAGLENMCRFMLPERLLGYLGERIIFVAVTDGEVREIAGRAVTFFDTGSVKAVQFGLHIQLKSGKTLVYLGDEPYHGVWPELLRGTDYLMHEAFCLYGDRQRYRPSEKNHSTVKDACANANKLAAGALILHHTEDDDLCHRKIKYTTEAKVFFDGAVFVPDDLDCIFL